MFSYFNSGYTHEGLSSFLIIAGKPLMFQDREYMYLYKLISNSTSKLIAQTYDGEIKVSSTTGDVKTKLKFFITNSITTGEILLK